MRSVWQRMRWLDDIIHSMDMSLSKLWEMVKDRQAHHAAVHGLTKSQTWLSDWTTEITLKFITEVTPKIYILRHDTKSWEVRTIFLMHLKLNWKVWLSDRACYHLIFKVVVNRFLSFKKFNTSLKIMINNLS